MVQSALFFEPGPFPGLPEPPGGPGGPKIGHKPKAGFIILSSIRSSQQGIAGPDWPAVRGYPSDVAVGGARQHPAKAADVPHRR